MSSTALGVGSALAEARQAQGLGLGEISQQLKFMPRQLEALESERFDMLPGPTIARGMVRTYARFLKLDPEPLLSRMQGHVETRDATPELAARFQQPVPFADSGRRSTVVYLALSAFVLAAGAAVFYEWRHETVPTEFVAAARIEPEAPRAPAPKAETPKAETPKTDTPKAAPQKAETPKAAPLVAAVSPAPVPFQGQAPQPQVQAAATAAPKSVGGNRMVLRFQEDAWLEVTNGAGKQLVSSLQPAGSERVVHCSSPCSLVVGNASHVQITYNDRAVDLQAHAKSDVARLTLK